MIAKKFIIRLSTIVANPWVLTIISALLYGFSFINPERLFWVCFIFLLPLLFVPFRVHNRLFWFGFLWGIISWSLQLYAVLHAIIDYGEGTYRAGAWIVLVLYFSFWSGLWFYILEQAKNFFYETWLFLLFCFLSFTYFFWIKRGVLFIFDRFEGNPFSDPLLPMVVHKDFFYYLHPWGNEILLFSLIIPQIAIIHFFYYRQKKYLLGLLFLIPFSVGWFVNNPVEDSPCLKKIGFINLAQAQRSDTAWQRAYIILEKCKQIIANKSEVEIIIGPESCFPFPLNRYPEFIALWSEYALDDRYLILGAHRQEEDKLYNTLYMLHKGRIIQTYDKKHGFPFTERVPTFFSWYEPLFLKEKTVFEVSDNDRVLIQCNEFCCIPFICSDLFFCYENHIIIPERAVLLCIANDSWFSCTYMKNLMKLITQFKSMALNCQDVYDSHNLPY